MIPVIYTWGYLSGSIDDLVSYVKALGAIVIDVRLVPWSSRPEWTQAAMRESLGRTNYRHIENFGNLNYKTPNAPFVLQAPSTGLAQIRGMDRQMILLCACRNHEKCHRSLVARVIAGEMGEPGKTVLIEPLPAKFSKWRGPMQLAHETLFA